mgnify:CR=1 FL=1
MEANRQFVCTRLWNKDEMLDEDKKQIVVMGSRPWECETTKNLLEKIRLCDHLVLICNYENILQAKNLARLYHHRIYCFPLDADPFRMTREKRKFFAKLLHQERW